ncbi:MAG: hypothetical protein GY820_47165 [Gammaproteobacteria bacterium]|nr:hypothetical protein [Gammaproteobacteria bacterium]
MSFRENAAEVKRIVKVKVFSSRSLIKKQITGKIHEGKEDEDLNPQRERTDPKKHRNNTRKGEMP